MKIRRFVSLALASLMLGALVLSLASCKKGGEEADAAKTDKADAPKTEKAGK